MIGALSAYGSYYTGSVYTRAAADSRINASINPGAVEPVKAVPRVYGNSDTERVKKTPDQMESDRNQAYDMMKAGSSRDAGHINGYSFDDAVSEAADGEDTIDAEKQLAEGTDGTEKTEAEERRDKQLGLEECETCKTRKYVDGSNEADVSFKTPGHIDPSSAASVVSAHEHQHVANAIQEGSKSDAELVSVSVSLQTSTCPECGRTYVSGGVTNTVMRHTTDGSDIDEAEALQQGNDPAKVA